jgi:hypothetical protein
VHAGHLAIIGRVRHVGLGSSIGLRGIPTIPSLRVESDPAADRESAARQSAKLRELNGDVEPGNANAYAQQNIMAQTQRDAWLARRLNSIENQIGNLNRPGYHWYR